jgi:hypothetical protein
MRFVFRFGKDSTLEVTGIPADTEAGGHEFRRSGPYYLDGPRLVSPALNEGQPVEIALQDGRLILTIDRTLVFKLRRE